MKSVYDIFPIGINETKTPEQLGRNIGDVLRSYPTDSIYEEPLKIKHLAKPGADITCTVGYTKTYVGLSLTYVFKAIASLHVPKPPTTRLSYDLSSESPFLAFHSDRHVPRETHCGDPGQLSVAPVKHTLGIESTQEIHNKMTKQVREFLCERERSLDSNSKDDTKRELEVDDARDMSAMGLAAGGKLSRAKYLSTLLLLT